MAELFAQLQLPGVEKIVVDNNEFGVKYRLLCEQPKQPFLLYFAHGVPPHEQNWLLDIQLAGYLFRTDQQAQFMQELGLDYHYHAFVTHHIEFFRNKTRREKLARLGVPRGETEPQLRTRMLAVVFGQESLSLSDSVLAYAAALTDDTHERLTAELHRYHLTESFWQAVQKRFGYTATSPTIYEFVLALFQTNTPLLTPVLNPDARILMNRWRSNLHYQDSFRLLSARVATDLNLPTRLPGTTLEVLLNDDLFEQVEGRIVQELARMLLSGSATVEQLETVQKARQNKHWYKTYALFYEALYQATALLTGVETEVNRAIESLADGPALYTQSLYRIDTHYRRFWYAYRKAAQPELLADVAAKVDAVYTNAWLLPLSARWQHLVDQAPDWTFGPLHTQRHFFRFQLEPQLAKGRTFVIISDALRYEWGRELADRMQLENRFVTQHSYVVSGLPSYTQLGMAALLPHTQLSIGPGSDAVLADGLPTQGTENRSAILARHKGVAITAEDFLSLNTNREGREWVKPYSFIYIYHNLIDRVGDTLATEAQLADKSEEVLTALQELIRKVANMNGVHIWITADHGFLYQQQPVADTDFLQATPTGQVWKQGRRFVLGHPLAGGEGFRRFEAAQVGLTGPASVLIPKGGQRLRLSGSGSRFVHGGATLQEVVVPLLKITKKKADTVSQVHIDVIRSQERITTNLVPISFLQQEPVGERVQPRQIRAMFEAADGTLLSDQFSYVFDSSETNDRLRELKHRFQLTQKAGSLYNNQRITLRLEEPIENTSQWKTYRTFSYLLTIAFTNDFDSF